MSAETRPEIVQNGAVDAEDAAERIMFKMTPLSMKADEALDQLQRHNDSQIFHNLDTSVNPIAPSIVDENVNSAAPKAPPTLNGPSDASAFEDVSTIPNGSSTLATSLEIDSSTISAEAPVSGDNIPDITANPNTNSSSTVVDHSAAPAATSAAKSVPSLDITPSAVPSIISDAVSTNAISPEEMARLRSTFASFDLRGDGFITVEELKVTLERLGVNVEAAEVKLMIDSGDKKRNGKIDFEEFLALMESTRKENKGEEEEEREDEMRAIFKVFDKDSTGFIHANDLRVVMKTLGEDVTDADVDAMMREADVAGDGVISFEEFRQLFGNKLVGVAPEEEEEEEEKGRKRRKWCCW